MSDLTLDENHVYRKAGKRYPGTNEVLNLYFPPSDFFTEEGREKGAARHQWFDFLCKGLVPEGEPDPRIALEVANFKDWLSVVKPVRIGGESLFFDPLLHVCGMPDWYGMVFGRLSVVDWKPDTKYKRTKLQTGAYAHNLRQNNIHILDRYELRLGETKYRFEKHEDNQDIERFKVMAYAYHAKTFYDR